MADQKQPFRHLSHAKYSKLTAEEKKNYIDAMLEDAKQRMAQGQVECPPDSQPKQRKD
jgi:hypothetical protein